MSREWNWDTTSVNGMVCTMVWRGWEDAKVICACVYLTFSDVIFCMLCAFRFAVYMLYIRADMYKVFSI